jgi:hypothetical protein
MNASPSRIPFDAARATEFHIVRHIRNTFFAFRAANAVRFFTGSALEMSSSVLGSQLKRS